MTRLRDRLSPGARRRLALLRVDARRPTAALRALPDFLIIGAQRGGTSSLYRYLGAHPDVFPSVRKETEFFSSYIGRGQGWYRAHFPTRRTLAIHERRHGAAAQTFEATPDYLFDPRAPANVAAALPEARLIVLLRDPVERAFSHYRHMRRLGFEDLEFDVALRQEEERISEDLDRAMHDPNHRPRAALRFSYVARGRYVEQLERWYAHFPRKQFLILDSNSLFVDPAAVVHQVCEFLGLQQWAPSVLTNHSYASEAERRKSQAVRVPETPRTDLEDRFADANDGLEELTGFPLTTRSPANFTTNS